MTVEDFLVLGGLIVLWWLWAEWSAARQWRTWQDYLQSRRDDYSKGLRGIKTWVPKLGVSVLVSTAVWAVMKEEDGFWPVGVLVFWTWAVYEFGKVNGRDAESKERFERHKSQRS
jgi:hypothetical protein